jgi:hypothetical protein
MSRSDLCCFGADNNSTHLYYIGDTGNVHLAWESAASHWFFSDLTKRAHGADPAARDSALACFGYQGQATRVHFLNSRSEVCQIAFEGNRWVFHNLTHDAKALNPKQPVRPAAPGSALACFGYQGKHTRVYFFDADGNVCQIASEDNQWIFHNLTYAATPAYPKQPVTRAAKRSAITCFGADGTDTHVYFFNDNGSVCEIAFANNQWVFTNLTHAALATDKNEPVKPARSGSALTCFGYEGKDARVYFMDHASQVCGMAWASGRWEFTNVSAKAHGRPGQLPPRLPAAQSALTCFGVSGRFAHVYYLDDSSLIWELAWNGDSWVGFAAQAQANIATNTNAEAAAGTALTCLGLAGESARIYYLRWQGEINELAYNKGSNQWVNRTIKDTRVPSSPVSPVSGAALEGSANYSLISGDLHPLLTGVSVNITVTQPIGLGSDSPAQGGTQVTGFGFQLNALSTSTQDAPGGITEQIVWQQYTIVLVGTQLQGIINNWTIPGVYINTYGNPAVLGSVPGSFIPAGYQLTIALGNDSSGNVTQVTFLVMDNWGNFVGHQTIQLSSFVTLQYMAPITAFGLYLVGPANSEAATLTSGSGMFTYSASNVLVVSPVVNPITLPTTLVEQGTGTAENANSFYGSLPVTGTLTSSIHMFAQPFQIGSKPQ